jgi:diguanylate cyclase (GGDEF)-like protein
LHRSTPELQPHSLIYSRILNTVIVLMLLTASVGWLQLRSLRAQFEDSVNRKAAAERAHVFLSVLERSVRVGQALPLDDAAQTARLSSVSQEVSAALLAMGTAPTILDEEQAASAREEAAAMQSGAVAPSSGDYHAQLSQAATSLAQWRVLEARSVHLHSETLARLTRTYESVKWAFGLMPIMILVAGFCAGMLKRGERLQAQQREEIEAELRRERSQLEKRIEARTAEMQAEVKERQRAEQLNRGRNQLLEMLAREEPQQEIFRTLVDVIAKDRSRWCCALHLAGQGEAGQGEAGQGEGRRVELHMQAHSGLPVSLVRNLQHVAVDMADAPEAAALRNRRTEILEDLANERKPWPQLLHASGIQSLWSLPIYAPDQTPLGTLTVYSLLRAKPSAAEMAMLESHAQMASMVLERYRLQEDLRRHAYHDSLTGLPNRLLGEEHLTSAIRRGRRSGQPLAVVWIDLDKFKQINDVHGHVAGDAVLKAVAARLSGRCRETDTVARMGGDEFMAVLEGVTDRAAAEQVARELLHDLAEPIPFQELMLSTGASAGISLFPDDGDTADQLQRNADLAMYEAKFGHFGVRSFSPALKSVLTERRELEIAMLRALEEGGFALQYQPQYGKDGRLSGLEALLRFHHPEMGMVSPARFIPIAEESQMIVALGEWVLREACRQSRRWQRAGLPPVRIAINISAVQFVRPDFADQVANALEESELPAALLELELTESVMVKDFEESSRQLKRLKRLGVSIALDDFGTGYSSLNQLHRLPIDRLKIDRSFVQAMLEPEGTLPIVESIIAMAHSMGAQVVGEGVESQQQMETLRMIGCDFLQGYLLSRPVVPEQAALLLAEGSCARVMAEWSDGPRLPLLQSQIGQLAGA